MIFDIFFISIKYFNIASSTLTFLLLTARCKGLSPRSFFLLGSRFLSCIKQSRQFSRPADIWMAARCKGLFPEPSARLNGSLSIGPTRHLSINKRIISERGSRVLKAEWIGRSPWLFLTSHFASRSNNSFTASVLPHSAEECKAVSPLSLISFISRSGKRSVSLVNLSYWAATLSIRPKYLFKLTWNWGLPSITFRIWLKSMLSSCFIARSKSSLRVFASWLICCSSTSASESNHKMHSKC